MKNALSISPCDTSAVCRNLRISTTAIGNALTPVGTPRSLPTAGMKPLCTYRHDDGSRSLFLHSGSRLYMLTDDADKPTELATLPSEPLCATACGDMVIVMTKEGAYYVDFCDGKWSARGLCPEFPAISISAGSHRDFIATTEPRTLSGSYSHWSGKLSDRDVESLTNDALNAYTRAADEARATGCYIQPIIARYRLRDRRGGILYESPAVMVSPDGFQGCEAVEPEVTNRSVVAGYAVALKGYRLHLSCEGECDPLWAKHVTTMELLVSPQMHPVDFAAQIDYRCQDGSPTDTLRISLPGTSVGNVAASETRADMVAATADRLDSCARTIVIAYPFLSGIASTKPIRPTTTLSPRQEASALKSALEKDVASQDFNFQHSIFNSKTVHTVGDMVIWGDISIMRHPGHPIHAFASETSDGSWRGCIVVTMADGSERVVWHGNGSDYAPTKLSPLLSYPSGDARTMTISLLLADGITRKATFELTPSGNGNTAYYIDSSLAPIELPSVDADYYVPASTTTARRYAGMVLASATETPLNPFASLDASQGAITAITSAVRSSSSWDFGRAHLYLFSTAGIYALAVTRSRSLASCQMLDCRPVVAHDAVTVMPTGVAAIAGRDVVRISASRVETLLRNTDYRAIGYNSAFDELLCLRTDSTLLIRDLSSGYCYTRNISPTSFYYDGILHAICADAMLDLSEESPTENVGVEWLHRFMLANGIKHISGIAWRLFATDTSLTMSLRGDRGGNTPLPLLDLNANGMVNAPIATRVIAPPRRYLTLQLAGTVAPDFTFESVQLHLK